MERQSDSGKFSAERNLMVERQIVARGIKSPLVIEALRRVPRHRFVPQDVRAQAYEDHPIPIGCGQTISQPYMVALMTEMLKLTGTERVLEIGTGSGYQSAVLAELASCVISVERKDALAERARAVLGELGCGNVEVFVDDGTVGCPERGPFDAILVTAGSPSVPAPLREQLAMGGRLVCPVGARDIQTLTKIERVPQGYKQTEGISCVFVPLIGAAGWPE